MNKESSLKNIRIKKGIYVLPNLITTAGLFAGFYSIVASLKENFVVAAVAILAAAVFDGLDGRIARFTNTASKFGAEYDSLSDVIAFGVAPAFLAYNWALSFYGKGGWIAAFLFVLCGALRLARYNIQIGIIESKVFNGLPIPAAASVVATTVLFFDYAGIEGKFHDPSMLIFVPVLSILMVSNIKYYSFKDLKLFARKPFITFFLLVLVLIIVATIPVISAFVAMTGYAISGPLWWMFKFSQQKHHKAKEKKANII
ncbi:MAG TPA: CDP-diacylglycerol--serine O-phosphatidyltransferase [Smithellaceae bacterium]|nr:CDP-diacylglycerol--serine O-phosphatidyltransferase [Smithellaceae bacterium]HOF78639.1 CDP-diacylglycerol--serine O-phosphatidyltransferase [Smithellaceae bacterium]HOM69702.1 CDP-diacylglycerol--serine O-phosphatidyltransferase [Smithellaceae bacterium]HOS10154.1 CDP-diacylglycerol--serine O-phosphatidyltransferase [Smithellaceae bacterium]HOU05379.1 CDP-diacylglycerol--serine O-phosphatidyltransferase [Smithellaceae bacterium]